MSWTTLGTVCLGYFMASWAMGPIAAILPTISRDLDVSVTVVGWTMNVYFLMLVGLLLVMGRLGDLFGHGRIFGLGLAAFTVGLLLCALSTNFPGLLVARAVQGIGSAMIFGTSLAIVTTAIPGTGRGKAIGFLTMASAASSLSGVWLTTWSAEHMNWHWAFLIPVPVGVAGAAIGLRLRLPRVQLESRRIDWAGAALLFATLTSATLALNHLHEGAESFQAGAPYHVSMHLLTVALLVAFIKVELRAEAPLLGFKLLRNASFSSAVVGNGIAHMSMLATGFLVPFLLERGRGLAPSDTGRLLMTQQVAMVACALALGYLYDRSRSPFFAAAMMASIAVGLLALGTAGGSLPYAALMFIAVVLGSGLGGFTTVNNTAVMSMAPDNQLGFASGLVETTRQFGHSIGVSLSGSIMGAALAGAAPTTEQYISGFQQAAFAMGLVAWAGVVALLWPKVRQARARLPAARGTAAGLVGRPPRIAGASK